MTHRAITFHLVIFLTATYNRLSMNSVLVIDDERNIRSLVSRVLGQENIEVHMAGTGKEGLWGPRAWKGGKPRREITRLQGMQEGKYRTNQIIGESTTTRRLREVITQLAQSEAHTILVQGESGTGKELVARGLHFESARRNSPFMEVNCAAITETLFESELFGHEKGAFTDAKSTKKGLMELADGGTLFLDEVGEIPLASQAKLLRCLQERTFKRVGGTRDLKVDVRVITATNRSLDVMVKEGKFREDLFYRLNVIPLTISREPRTLEAVEKAYILKVLRQVNGNKSEAAKILGITRQTLRKKLTEASA